MHCHWFLFGLVSWGRLVFIGCAPFPLTFGHFPLSLTRTNFWALGPNQLHLTGIWILYTANFANSCKFCEEKGRWLREAVCVSHVTRLQSQPQHCWCQPGAKPESAPALLESPVNRAQGFVSAAQTHTLRTCLRSRDAFCLLHGDMGGKKRLSLGRKPREGGCFYNIGNCCFLCFIFLLYTSKLLYKFDRMVLKSTQKSCHFIP